MKLRIGVLGLGAYWESRYRPALAALPDRFAVRGIYAPVARLAAAAAEKLHAVAVDGFRALVARPDIDAVLVLACQWCGPLPLIAACEAGKAIYWAADLDLDLEEALAVQQRIDRSGVACLAEFARRLAPATVRLKELIATRLGRPQLVLCDQRGGTGERRDAARAGVRSGSGRRALVELVDWCRYVVGSEPTAVHAVAQQRAAEAGEVDYQRLTLDYASPERPGTGPLAEIVCSELLHQRWPEAVSFRPPSQFQVHCERGVAYVDLPRTLVWFDAAGSHTEVLDDERPVGEQLLMHFYRAVTSLVRKTSDIEDRCRAMQIVLAAEASQRSGERMPLPPPCQPPQRETY